TKMMQPNVPVIWLISWNVNGIRHPIKRKKILSTLRAKWYDLAFLQETHLVAKEAAKLHQSCVGQNSKSRGTAILIRKNLPINILSDYADPEGHFNILEARLDGQHVLFVCVYAPNKDDLEFFCHLIGKVGEFGDVPVIGGSLNEVMDPIIDKSKFRSGPVPGAALHCLISCLGLFDIWHLTNLTDRDYSFFSASHEVYSHIDMFLIPNGFVESVVEASIGYRRLSDHVPISLTWALSDHFATSKRWRLNTALLTDKAIVDSLKTEIKYFLSLNTASSPSKQTLWEALKAFVRSRLMARASYLKKLRTAKQLDLEKDISELEKQLMIQGDAQLASTLATKK
uniref:exodeoxyribonuclease III n=1 Tax=Latimeria chalumnae TaxID=7897 RepID=H3A1Q3_LATCH